MRGGAGAGLSVVPVEAGSFVMVRLGLMLARIIHVYEPIRPDGRQPEVRAEFIKERIRRGHRRRRKLNSAVGHYVKQLRNALTGPFFNLRAVPVIKGGGGPARRPFVKVARRGNATANRFTD